MTEFRKILKYLFFLLFALEFFYTKVSASDLVFPFPKGSVYVINGYNESDSHQKKSLYSLDFRSYEGNDQCDSYGSPILASERGQIIFLKNESDKGKDKGYGTHVVIKTGAGEKIWYAHMIYGSIFVHGPTDANKNLIGDIVQKGQILGLLGDTGFACGMKCNVQGRKSIGHHLHFEMRDQDGKAFKPEPMEGEKSYTNLSKAGNPYISTTVMIDPGKFWDQWKGKVPYKLFDVPPINIAEKEYMIGNKEINADEEGILAKLWKFIFTFVSRKKTWTNEEAFEYVKKANGDYSENFLKWAGWEKNNELFDTASAPSHLIYGSHYLLKESIPDIEKIRTVLDSHEIELLEMSRLPQAYIAAFLPSDDELEDGSYSCPIPEGISNSLKKIASYKNHFEFMEKLWNSPLPPSLKFYVQERIDFIIRLAGYYFKNEDAACRFSDQGIVSSTLRESYKQIPFDKLQKIYQQYFSKNR